RAAAAVGLLVAEELHGFLLASARLVFLARRRQLPDLAQQVADTREIALRLGLENVLEGAGERWGVRVGSGRLPAAGKRRRGDEGGQENDSQDASHADAP